MLLFVTVTEIIWRQAPRAGVRRAVVESVAFLFKDSIVPPAYLFGRLFFPTVVAYAPELNPDEGVWAQAKRELANSHGARQSDGKPLKEIGVLFRNGHPRSECR